MGANHGNICARGVAVSCKNSCEMAVQSLGRDHGGTALIADPSALGNSTHQNKPNGHPNGREANDEEPVTTLKNDRVTRRTERVSG